jgi:hypothetical protein
MNPAFFLILFIQSFSIWLPIAEAKEKFDPHPSVCKFDKFMENYARKAKGAPALNTFLVSMNSKHPDNEYWVYWPQKRKILLIGWPAKDCKNPEVLVRSELDLEKDVVKTEEDVGSSSHLVTEKWASEVLLDAARSGYQVNVKK